MNKINRYAPSKYQIDGAVFMLNVEIFKNTVFV